MHPSVQGLFVDPEVSSDLVVWTILAEGGSNGLNLVFRSKRRRFFFPTTHLLLASLPAELGVRQIGAIPGWGKTLQSGSTSVG